MDGVKPGFEILDLTLDSIALSHVVDRFGRAVLECVLVKSFVEFGKMYIHVSAQFSLKIVEHLLGRLQVVLPVANLFGDIFREDIQ